MLGWGVNKTQFSQSYHMVICFNSTMKWAIGVITLPGSEDCTWVYAGPSLEVGGGGCNGVEGRLAGMPLKMLPI